MSRVLPVTYAGTGYSALRERLSPPWRSGLSRCLFSASGCRLNSAVLLLKTSASSLSSLVPWRGCGVGTTGPSGEALCTRPHHLDLDRPRLLAALIQRSLFCRHHDHDQICAGNDAPGCRRGSHPHTAPRVNHRDPATTSHPMAREAESESTSLKEGNHGFIDHRPC